MLKIPLEIFAHLSLEEATSIIRKKSITELVFINTYLERRRWYLIYEIAFKHLVDFLAKFNQLEVSHKTQTILNTKMMRFLLQNITIPPIEIHDFTELIPEEIQKQTHSLMLSGFQKRNLQQLLDEFTLTDYRDISNMLLREILSRDELHTALRETRFEIDTIYSIKEPCLKHPHEREQCNRGILRL